MNARRRSDALFIVVKYESVHADRIAFLNSRLFKIGKSSLTPEITKSVEEALNARELIKIHVLKNCADDGKDLAQILAERTHSEVVQVIGKMIVLYKPAKEEKDRKIILP